MPSAVRKFVDRIPHPVALIGCRATKMSLDCCEYDLAVFAPGDNQIVRVDGYAIEMMYFSKPSKNYAVELESMIMLKDTNKFAVSSATKNIAEKYKMALAAAGRKSLINSLFRQQKMSRAKQPAIAAMWLKIAAYDFMEGMLAISGSRTMPLHELEQVRQVANMAEGANVALECIGIERATRPTIARSLQAVMELKSDDYDSDLLASKFEYLLGKSKLADCYYYAGKIAAKKLIEKNEKFHDPYAKLIQLALDLSNDVQHLETLQKKLFKAVKDGLKG